MVGGSPVRGHRGIPASRISPPLPNCSVRASPYLQGAQQAQVGLREIPAGEAVGDLGQPSQGKGKEERDRGGAEFQSPRNLVPRSLESQSRRHIHAGHA